MDEHGVALGGGRARTFRVDGGDELGWRLVGHVEQRRTGDVLDLEQEGEIGVGRDGPVARSGVTEGVLGRNVDLHDVARLQPLELLVDAGQERLLAEHERRRRAGSEVAADLGAVGAELGGEVRGDGVELLGDAPVTGPSVITVLVTSSTRPSGSVMSGTSRTSSTSMM